MTGYRALQNRPVRYPFGHGLSYSTFALDLANVTITNDRVRLEVLVENDGAAAAATVVQLYVAFPGAERLFVLKGFEAVRLGPGETKRVVLDLSRKRDLAAFDGSKWGPVEGTFEARVGFSSRDVRAETAFETAPAGRSGARGGSPVSAWIILGPAALLAALCLGSRLRRRYGDRVRRRREGETALQLTAAFDRARGASRVDEDWGDLRELEERLDAAFDRTSEADERKVGDADDVDAALRFSRVPTSPQAFV